MDPAFGIYSRSCQLDTYMLNSTRLPFFAFFFLFYFSILTSPFDFEESFLGVYMLGIRPLFVLITF